MDPKVILKSLRFGEINRGWRGLTRAASVTDRRVSAMKLIIELNEETTGFVSLVRPFPTEHPKTWPSQSLQTGPGICRDFADHFYLPSRKPPFQQYQLAK